MRELPDGIDVSALDDACYEYHREYVSDWDANQLAPRVAAIRAALGLGDAQSGGVLRHAVREWMDVDQDYNELRATIVSDLRILADRDGVTTGDIHALADEIESGGKFEPSPAAVTPEPAGPRLREWTGSEGGHIYEVQPGWAIWAVSREKAEAEHARYNLGVQCSYGIKVEDLAYHGATEVPAVPPAEPGAGA